MKTIIFSKNRACQLDLLLRGLNIPATVLYAHDQEFAAGYEKLKSMYPGITFEKEYDFKKQLISLMDDDYIMFLVDDDIMIEPFDIDCKEFNQFKNDDNILCMSIRLAEQFNNVWRWKNKAHSWGYPMSVTSNIFRKKDIFPIMEKENFDNPNELEVVLRNNIPDKPYMICGKTQKFINNLANQVQTQYKFKNLKISLSELEMQFVSGKRINLKDMIQKAKNKYDCFMMEPYEYE